MTAPYLDPALPVAQRVADLLGRMTVEEKVGQMMQLDAREDLDDQVLRVHVGSILHTSPERVLRAHDLTEQTRLRIPLLVGEDCIHGHSFWEGATIFPTQLGMAASWDARLLQRGQQPTYYNQIRGQHGDRYADLTQSPAFAFGEGLSYTWVEYSDLRLAEEHVAAGGAVRAELTLLNVGERPVRETVQAYVSDRVTSVSWADQELKGFLQVDLAPGEEKCVALEIPVADLAIVDAKGDHVVEPGEFELRIGRSSRDPWTQRITFRIG